MNGKDLLSGLGEIDLAFYEEAEASPSIGRKFRRPFLAAALIAMMLLLTGCAVAYVLTVKDMKVGERNESRPVFASNGIKLTGFEEVTYQVLALGELKDTPGYQAAAEWYACKESHDPDPADLGKGTSEMTIPEAYTYYDVDSQEMKEALDGILQKYDLKTIGVPLKFETTQDLCTALGIEKIIADEDSLFIRCESGTYFDGGSFRLNLQLTLPGEAEGETKDTWGILRWSRKDCLSPENVLAAESDDWKAWRYTTASGNPLFILRSETDGRGWIICDREDAVLTVTIDAQMGVTDRQLEQIADAVDRGIQPQTIRREDVPNPPETAKAVTQNGYTVALKSVKTDADRVRILLGVTAPEGVDITDRETFSIHPANDLSLTPAEGEVYSGTASVGAREDGDGLANTQDIVIEAAWEMADGSQPFAPGRVWKLCIEDLTNRYWWYPDVADAPLAYGVWQFEITIEEAMMTSEEQP